MRVVLVVAAGVALAAFTYLWLERLGRRALVPLLCRAVAWSALGLLLLNIGCPIEDQPGRPLVLLDGSLSLSAAGGRWREARETAQRLGEVRQFGDETSGDDSVPRRGRSLLRPALAAAAASGRPVTVVSDGEIEDAAELPRDLMARASVRLFPRTPVPDVAITTVSGPARIAAGDSLTIDVDVQAYAGAAPDSVTLAVELGDGRAVRRTVPLAAQGSARARLRMPSTGLGAGDHMLRITIPPGDAERRTDVRLHALSVVPTPGVVLLATTVDWDARFLYSTVKDVARLPVRGYARLEPDRWRSLRDLSVVGDQALRDAVRRADLLILKGPPPRDLPMGRARGVWRWPDGESDGAPPVVGDWYLQTGTGPSPLDAAFAGAPIDSFAPAVQLVTRRSADDEWVALYARNGRRGPEWPVVAGRDGGRVREVSVLADGLWRWAFRGGTSEQAYRSWVAAAVSWLLAGADTAQGVARPVRQVVENGRPVVFEWIGGGSPKPAAIQWTGAPAGAADTLRFDGGGRASVRLPPGIYRYRLAAGGGGIVAVEEYSQELLPRTATISSRTAAVSGSRSQRSSRDFPWLFLAAVVGFSGEWVARRRMGLR
ncbi:MAG TPA: hypothetical protein VFM14_13025 [Gemmatimonadales bacterium]|nr:hypothetical protein [Gemmatimonadales bacterium]